MDDIAARSLIVDAINEAIRDLRGTKCQSAKAAARKRRATLWLVSADALHFFDLVNLDLPTSLRALRWTVHAKHLLKTDHQLKPTQRARLAEAIEYLDRSIA